VVSIVSPIFLFSGRWPQSIRKCSMSLITGMDGRPTPNYCLGANIRALLVVDRKPICCFVGLRNFCWMTWRSLCSMSATPSGNAIAGIKKTLCFMYASVFVVALCRSVPPNAIEFFRRTSIVLFHCCRELGSIQGISRLRWFLFVRYLCWPFLYR
jgi:hypothetical protein